MLSANLIAQMIRDRQLHKVARNSFVAQNRPRIFDRRADVKILGVGVVSQNKKESHRVFVINAGGIHETARTRRLERVRQLSNLKWSEVIRDGDELMFLQEIDHLSLTIFV